VDWRGPCYNYRSENSRGSVEDVIHELLQLNVIVETLHTEYSTDSIQMWVIFVKKHCDIKH